MTKPAWTLRVILVFGILALPSSAQDLLNLNTQCDYFTDLPGQQTYEFPPDTKVEGLIRQILNLVDAEKNFEVRASNVPLVTSGSVGNRRFLLYNQFQFWTESTGPMKWANIAILAHQIGHNVSKHVLSQDPTKRREEELEADRFSGYVLYKLGSSIQQAASALEMSSTVKRPDYYPSKSSRIDAILSVWKAAKFVADNYDTSSADDEIPRFEWPAPKPSAYMTLPRSLLVHGPSFIFQIASTLENALEKAGYSERSYYSVPDGFALVSRIEQITQTGEPKMPYERWSIDLKPPHVFSLRSYFSSLFTATPGKYRVIAFVVTPHPVITTGESPDFTTSKDWLWSGSNKLPTSIRNLRFSDEYSCTALIYEFDRATSDSAVTLRVPGSLTGKMHLEKAAIWQALGGS